MLVSKSSAEKIVGFFPRIGKEIGHNCQNVQIVNISQQIKLVFLQKYRLDIAKFSDFFAAF